MTCHPLGLHLTCLTAGGYAGRFAWSGFGVKSIRGKTGQAGEHLVVRSVISEFS